MVKLIQHVLMEVSFTNVHEPSLICGAEFAQDHSGASGLSSLLPGHLQPYPALPHCLCHHRLTCVWRHPAER